MDNHERPAAPGDRCTHFVLARGAAAEVDYCVACGIFRLNIDTVTVRFRATGLRDLRDTVSAALSAYQRALDQLPDEASAPQRPDGLH